MASASFTLICFYLLAAMVSASDPDILSDFLIPANSTTLDGNFFTFTRLHGIFDADYPPNFKFTKARRQISLLNGMNVSFATLESPTGTLNPPHIHPRSADLLIVVDGSLEVDYPPNFKFTKARRQISLLNGMNVSFATLEYPAGTFNPPHIHPRLAELLIIVDGSLEVDFVDTNSKLYTQTLQVPNIFVFPKGLVHYQYNPSSDQPAKAVLAFGSAVVATIGDGSWSQGQILKPATILQVIWLACYHSNHLIATS